MAPRASSSRVLSPDTESMSDMTEHDPLHGKLWFLDGNVVLVAEATSFRVHASVLSQSSAVFRDLFRGPATESSCDHGCPVFQLQDTAEDLKTLLTAFYSGITTYRLTAKRLPFSEVASLVRMGHKYKIDRLRDDGLARLKSCFPSTWSSEGWDTFAENQSAVMTMVNEDAVAAVNLARLTQTDPILPMALYGCCHISIPTLLSGYHRALGRKVGKLSDEDVIRCLEGKEKLSAARTTASSWLFRLDCSPKCTAPGRCGETFRVVLKEARDGMYPATSRALDPLLPDLDIEGTVCPNCWDMLTAKDDEMQRGLFACLPALMGVSVRGWGS